MSRKCAASAAVISKEPTLPILEVARPYAAYGRERGPRPTLLSICNTAIGHKPKPWPNFCNDHFSPPAFAVSYLWNKVTSFPNPYEVEVSIFRFVTYSNAF